ncbi:MAG TPA: YigZ family protein [Spirochaetia bacterium]|nr:YigZ family protein [Spirochaetaceae bacterium]HPE90498.1 YigZ family protein [Spirochaetales bacterium]HRW25508.1 YigZ family protein [Spirochaetia bacterium]
MLIVPYGRARAEITVVNSRFIASLAPADSVEAARAYIAGIRAEFPDATHNVPAFIIGGGNAVTEFCSDDGEPSGTSGRPLLAALKGSGLGNAVVVVTRYFGGTLLGTGGLVKAYSEAGKAVLAVARRAELVETRRLAFDAPYHLFERVRSLAESSGATIISENFAESVALELDVAAAGCDAFLSALANLSAGAIAPRLGSTRLTARPL